MRGRNRARLREMFEEECEEEGGWNIEVDRSLEGRGQGERDKGRYKEVVTK